MRVTEILDHPLITERYFFPRRVRLPEGLRAPVTAADGVTLACGHHAKPQAPLTVLIFYGNGEVATDHLDLVEWLSALGLDVWINEYRGYGQSEGAPELGRMLEDVRAVLRATNAPPDRLVVFGRSVGSLFALRALREHPNLAGIIIESGVADPLERLELRVTAQELGVSRDALAAAVAEAMPQRMTLQASRAPALILHAEHDHLIDANHARRLYHWAPRARLVIFPQGDHNSVFWMNQGAYLREVRGFLKGLIARRGA